MKRIVVHAAAAMVIVSCLSVSLVEAQQRGRGGARGGGRAPNEAERERKPEGRGPGAERESSSRRPEGGNRSGRGEAPGGEWSQRTHSGSSNIGRSGTQNEHKAGAAAGASNANGRTKTGQPSGAKDAAAGAAAANRNAPKASGAQGAAAGAAAANRNSPQFSGAQGAAAGAAAANRNDPALSGAADYAGVRTGVANPNIYGHDWYGAHPTAWVATGWTAGAAYVPTSWATMAGMYGYGNRPPISYNYGNNVNYQNGNVLVDGQPVGTAAEFSQQAADLAQTGAAADVSGTEKWFPLGVFAMVRNESDRPHLILQLAVNNDGIVRGNYTDEANDRTSPIHGAVDKETQRAAWTVGDNTQTVMEAGLQNLTEKEAPALIHKNGKTDHWILVRLEQPK